MAWIVGSNYLLEIFLNMVCNRRNSIQWCPLLLGVKGEMDLGLGPGSLYILRSCLLDLWRSYSSKTLPRVPHRPPHEPSHDEHDKTRTKLTLLRLSVETRHFSQKSTILNRDLSRERERECMWRWCFLGKGKCMRYAFIKPNTCTVAQRWLRHWFDIDINYQILHWYHREIPANGWKSELFRPHPTLPD